MKKFLSLLVLYFIIIISSKAQLPNLVEIEQSKQRLKEIGVLKVTVVNDTLEMRMHEPLGVKKMHQKGGFVFYERQLQKK